MNLNHLRAVMMLGLGFGRAAFAAPQAPGAGDCVVASEPGVRGQTYGVSQKDQPGLVSRKVAFTPQSVFVADGFAVELFAEADFKGNAVLVGDAYQLNEVVMTYPWEIHPVKTAGGHYVNLADLKDQKAIGSFACVKAGRLLPAPDYFPGGSVGYVVYDDETFEWQGWRGSNAFHSYTYATIREVNGRPIYTVTRSVEAWIPVNYTSLSFAMDLYSRDITVTTDGRRNGAPRLVKTIKYTDGADGDIPFEYDGALTHLVEFAKNTANNQFREISPEQPPIRHLQLLRSMPLAPDVYSSYAH